MTEHEIKNILYEIINENTLKKYRIERNLFVNWAGVHGRDHARRVLILTAILQRLNNLDDESIRLAAIYHDIGRLNDGTDKQHGLRSAEKCKNKNDYFGYILFNSRGIEEIKDLVKYNWLLSDREFWSIMSNEEISKLKSMPLKIKIYRACRKDENENGFNWTFDYDTAVQCYARHNNNNLLLTGEINKLNIIALFEKNNKGEIICSPNDVRIINRLDIVKISNKDQWNKIVKKVTLKKITMPLFNRIFRIN